MSTNPYAAPVYDTGKSGMGPAIHPMQPLADVAGWMAFLGWVGIVLGVLYCLTIVGAIVGWLPIWMGILLRGASASIRDGFARSDNNALLNGSRQLATLAVIVSVLAILWLVIMVIYAGIMLVILAGAAAGAFR